MKKVLIADDEVMACTLIRRILENHFPQIGLICEAANGKIALEKASEVKPDIAILDIEMPLIDGMEAGRRIKALIPECKIIYLTAFAEFRYARQAVSIGAIEFLLKPLDENELVQTIEKIFERDDEEELASWKKTPEDRRAEEPADSDEPDGWMGNRTAMVVKEAKKYIDNNYMDDISVEELVERYQLSLNHFNKIFKQFYGVSCKEYIITVRINMAKQYLSSPFLSVREAGAMAGYPDSNYFTKVFRKKIGVTPTEYRNQIFFQPED